MDVPHSTAPSSAGSLTEAEPVDPLPVPAEGTVIGRYVVLGVVGRGGMGVVLAAFDPELDRKVALKLLHAGGTSEGKARLQREAQALARLAHEHVIRVHDVGTFEDRVFVAMELVSGGTLAEWLVKRRRSVPEVLRAFTAAGEGLAAAHGAGLVHRDFKPSNVLMGDDGRVKVTDFGLARAHVDPVVVAAAGSSDELRTLDSISPEATLTRTGALVGTPAYMAPEQFDGRAVDPRADQFAFCVALFEALAGARPFSGSTPARIVASIMAQRFTVALPSTLPRSLRRAVLRGLRVDPAERHPDMHALLRELGHARSTRRRRASWGLAVAATLAGGGTLWALRAPEAPVAEDYCATVSERLAGVWDDARRDRSQQAFEATGLSYAADTWARTRDRLDAQASAWVEAQREVCEAEAALARQGAAADDASRARTDVESPALDREALDRRMVCLHRRLAELRQLGDLLVDADAALVERAPQAADALGSIDACSDPEPGPSETLAPDSLAHVEALAQIRILQEAGRYDDAVAAAEAAKAAMGSSRVEQAEALLALANAQETAGRIAEAEQHFHDAFSAAVGGGHHDVAMNAALGLADVVSRAAEPRFDEAERWTEHAAAAFAQLDDTPGYLGRIEAARGRIDHERGEYAAALEHFERALELRTKELGPDHYLLANHHNNLGHTYAALERQHDAIEHERRALELERAHYGAEHPRVGRALSALTASYSDAGRLDEAIDAGTQAVALLRRTVGEEHPTLGTALVNLGTAQSRAGRRDEAERSFLDALANAKLAHGERHRRVGLALNNLGVHYEVAGKLVEAERYHRQAAEVFVESLGAAHPTTAIVQSNLASVLVKQGRLDEAEGVLRQTLATLEERLGVDHPDVAVPMALLGQVLMDRTRYKEALPLLERVHVLWKPGQAPPEDVAAVLFALGSALWESGEDRKRGLELVTRAHGHYRQLGDARPEKIDETAAWLRAHGVSVP